MSESNVVTPPHSFTIAILEAALAERDARIKELEALVERMKCCGNCKYGRANGEECLAYCSKDGSGGTNRWEAGR